ncbi:MAG: hypothetical protein JW741_21455 [Sedimentisphaerales bacterium]|nr:hypothetical protein [Sedimentisphaerales bacterium]
MRNDDSMEHRLRDLRYEATAERRAKTLETLMNVLDESREESPAPGRLRIGRFTMNAKTSRFALAAAIILIVLGGVTFWPSGDAGNGSWWLGPSAAWSQGVLDYLDSIEAVVYRQRSGYVSDYGPAKMSRGWERRYNAADRYRRDRYDDGVNIMNTQWVVPEGDGLLMVEVSHEYECYFTRENEAYGFEEGITERLRSYVRRVDKADRLLEPEVFEGRECVGFEISAAKYGDNPKTRFDRIWFDVETKLPARIERHGISLDFDPGRTLVIIHDQFQYYADVPADLFEPAIPEGYVNAHPDEVRAARDRQAKGEMPVAAVPAGLKDKIVAALKAVETGLYHERDYVYSFSKDAWRREHYIGERLSQGKWYVSEQDLPEGPFELQGGSVVTETTVDFDSRTATVCEHAGSSQPRHPMQYIVFVAGLIERADRFYELRNIEGTTCFGFEVSAKKYGDNPDGMIHRLWFDATTTLPVRMEFESPRDDGGTYVKVKNRFIWNPEFSADYFEPAIPSDFAVTRTSNP